MRHHDRYGTAAQPRFGAAGPFLRTSTATPPPPSSSTPPQPSAPSPSWQNASSPCERQRRQITSRICLQCFKRRLVHSLLMHVLFSFFFALSLFVPKCSCMLANAAVNVGNARGAAERCKAKDLLEGTGNV
uniref:Uncharacterized protein n=1 Tax=Anopheles maculatus TaxID=74869 RepID=A0A182SKQ4_9DIPT